MQDVVPKWKRRSRTRPPFECIALLLQGGGALGAYQAGVYQALSESNVHPDWVAGISIGAINSAIIAGNPPEQRIDRLRAFWKASPPTRCLIGLPQPTSSHPRGTSPAALFNQLSAAWAHARRGAGFFRTTPAGAVAATRRLPRSDKLL